MATQFGYHVYWEGEEEPQVGGIVGALRFVQSKHAAKALHSPSRHNADPPTHPPHPLRCCRCSLSSRCGT